MFLFGTGTTKTSTQLPMCTLLCCNAGDRAVCDRVVLRYAAADAAFNPAMSIFFICIIAAMTRCDLAGSLSWMSSISALGTICQDSPYLSLSQPHCTC